MVDEVEQTVVRPVQILEEQDDRLLLGERLEQSPPRREGLLAAPDWVLVLIDDANQRP